LNDGYVKVCDIKADMSNLSGALERVSGTKGIWWQLNYEIGIQFGATELSAKMYWKENGSECESNMTVIPKEFT